MNRWRGFWNGIGASLYAMGYVSLLTPGGFPLLSLSAVAVAFYWVIDSIVSLYDSTKWRWT